ncbi:MAG: FG-GAP repeat domain-containing protein, partial [Verrucomicrobiota bacterium]
MSTAPHRPDLDPEEMVAGDDQAVGRGLRISLFIVLVLASVGGAVWIALRPPKVAGPVKVTQLKAPETANTNVLAQIPKATFTDVTASAGIGFRHETGAYGDKLLPETMGSGVAFADLDGDTAPELLFVNGTQWPGKLPAGSKPATAVLYRNDGKGGFQDATAGSGLDIPLYGMGVAVGDYDNDGRRDVLITTVGGARLFHNEGGLKFKDVTPQAGVGGNAKDWSTAAAFLDHDNDGDLDLYVGNYVRWSPEIDREVNYTLVGVGRAYGPPMNFEGAFPHFYRNNGDGTFTEISAESGVQVKNPATGVPTAKTLGVAPVDYNQDGWIDIAVANDTTQNLLFENQKNGTFKEVGALSGIAFDSYGNTRGAMGIDTSRFTPDGKLGVAIGNFANEMTALYVDNGINFTDESIPWGIGPASRLLLKFGIFFFDYDLDGRPDVLTSNGHLEEEISKVQASQSYRQPAQLFWNAGDGGFLNVSTNQAGSALFQPIVGRGSATADMDGDG